MILSARSTPGPPAWTAWLLLLVALPYWGTLHFPFVFDDQHGIVQNSAIRHLWPPAATMASEPDSTPWGRPLLAYSFALNYYWGGLAPIGYRLANLALHVCNAWLLLQLLIRLERASRALSTARAEGARLAGDSAARGRAWLPLGVALVWAAHPLTTNAVAYVSQRAESLMVSCYLLTTLGAAYAFEAWAAGQTPAARIRTTAMWAACALGMLAKESMVTAPVAVVLLQLAFFPAVWRGRRGAAVLFYGGLAASWLVLAAVMTIWPRAQSVGAVPGFGPWQSLLAQSEAILHYLRLAVWPYGLTIDYGWPVRLQFAEVWPAFAAVGVLGVGAVALWRVSRAAGFAATMFFLVLAPTSSFVPVVTQVAGEHRMYLPLACVVALVAMVAIGLVEKARDGRSANPARWPALGLPAVAGLVLALLGVTAVRLRVFESDERLWRDTLARQPRNARALNNLGSIYSGQGRAVEAEALYRRALAEAPDYDDALLNLGVLVGQRGDPVEAERLFRRCTEVSPTNGSAWSDLGIVCGMQGRREEARANFERALLLVPTDAAASYNLAVMCFQDGNYPRALSLVQTVLRSNPDHPDAPTLLRAILDRYQP